MRFVIVALFAVTFAGCSSCGGKNVGPDASDVNLNCGDGIIDPGEDCDDGDQLIDLVCDANCRFTCGNGVVDETLGELCDPGIASGAGACPTACDDGVACTSDVLSGSSCQTECVSSAITQPANGDGCCPSGANATSDNDCTAVCGNGILESGEKCDTAITSGLGACPATCNDGVACTTDVLSGTACQQACSNTAITTPANGDGCCPAGANSTNDNDCLASCGNGVVDAGETCDTAINGGAGKCPTSCSDGNSCTRDTLDNPGSCTAVCRFTAITSPTNNDGCCPAGANANNDNDCAPSCGNGVLEAGEQCDDGNTNNTDACSNACLIAPVAFRFSDLDLRDPHTFVSVLTCRDVTDNALLGFSVNGSLQTNIQTDADGDGLLDLSPTLVFRMYNQTAATQPVELYFASCTAPMSSTSCRAAGTPISATATNMTSGTCLAPIAGTIRGPSPTYSPAITSSTAPCFSTGQVTVSISLAGVPITLHDARIGATYVGNPATSLANGLLIGFLTEADADATILPSTLPLVGGKPLSSILPGGKNNCASFSDKDTYNSAAGWWFYLNYPATRVPWSDM